MAEIELEGVWKVYADGTEAVKDLTITVGDGEFVVFVGPSGCGKTTALRMIAGLEEISAGKIRIADRVVNDVPARDRDVAMVFQNYALYPHLTVRENIGFGLKLRKMDRAVINERVNHAAEILGITELLDKKPKALSGGQRQRVAMGRAIVRQPEAFLMDEPLSNLDAKLRVQMRAEVLRIQQELGVTVVYVTHDQTEAMTMGDRVAVIRGGILQQIAAPQVLYDNPVNLFVAGFIGSPAMNIVEAKITRKGDVLTATFGSTELTLGDQVLSHHPDLERHIGESVILGIRPEEMEDAATVGGPVKGATIDATATLVEKLGSEILVHFEVDAPRVVTDDVRELVEDIGAITSEDLGKAAATNVSEFVAMVSPRSVVDKGTAITLNVDTTRLHFFDVETGIALGGLRATGKTGPPHSHGLVATHEQNPETEGDST
ncbi:MAG: sn-glycerol-3-phosphate ABC transporter ATP-binding protein UgpC [Acidimicrobiia bacterium]|nr:sn-glycerol-3-phosphate ABC transporter ATP-binding protein UgpC [Acidimicrobiia bacterium]